MAKLVSGVRIDGSGRITHVRWQDAVGARRRAVGETSIVEISEAIDYIMDNAEPLIPALTDGARVIGKPVCVSVMAGGEEVLVDADDRGDGLRLEDLPRV